MDYFPYMQRIETGLGKIKAANRIDETQWLDVLMRDLHDASRDCTDELEAETGISYQKPGYTLHLHEAPPTRLLALALVVAPWLGWVMREKQDEDPQRAFSAPDCLRRIQEAFEFGVQCSRSGRTP